MSRLHRLRSAFPGAGVEALLVSNVANIRYLLSAPTSFDDQFGGALLVAEDGAWLVCDFRYFGEAESVAGPEVTMVEVEGPKVKTVADLVDRVGLSRTGIESRSVTVAFFEKLKSSLPGELVLTDGLVERVRETKSLREIDALRQSAEVVDRVLESTAEFLKPGRREIEVAFDIESRFRELGAEDVSFDPIVASGPNSSRPHARAGERVLCSGDIIKLDIGCRRGGYCSDITRVFSLGAVGAEDAAMYRLLVRAREAALEALAIGASCSEIDGAAREILLGNDRGATFGHNLGHGVGLSVHERPVLGPASDQRLAEGMVFTIEPGLYLPDVVGMRLEDMVALVKGKAEILTSAKRDLVEL